MQTHSTRQPNRAEKDWIEFALDFGCVVCRRQGRGFVPAEYHHIVSGNRRMGHEYGFGLCSPGHHRNAPRSSGEVSRHPDKAEFERRYGTEFELLDYLKRRYNMMKGMAA